MTENIKIADKFKANDKIRKVYAKILPVTD
jgi:hypothetical protein